MEASRAGTTPPSAQQGFKELNAAGAELHRNPSAAASLSQADSAPLGASDLKPKPSSDAAPAASGQSQGGSAATEGQPGLQDRVKREFERLMAQGGLSANEAGVQALQNALRQDPS